MAHAVSADAHEDHAHGAGHHVFDRTVLIRTFVGLVALTLLTVILALMERSGALPLGPLSVPVALAIAGAKAFLVASFFMNLWYEKGTNLLVFVGSIVFVVIFFGITFLDFAYRDAFEEQAATPVDLIQADIQAAESESQSIQEQFESMPLVEEADPALFGRQAPPASMDATPAIDTNSGLIETPTSPAPGEIPAPADQN